jgi:PEP-CTERM motif
MNVRKCLSRNSARFCLAVGLCGFAAANAEAAIVVSNPDADFSSTPYTISFGGGTATYTFTDIYDPTDIFSTIADAVSTGGDALVNSFFSEPTPFQQGSSLPDPVYDTYMSFPTPGVGIPYSISEAFTGLEFTLADGIHYGYVTTFGTEVLQYAYNSTPGGSIAIPTPEPATWVMLIVGLGTLGATARVRTSRTPRNA